ncbi:MAG: hypothetical protein HDR86_06885 [Bacteroides sp.]|nr:hypothetical protein [Bacteroides sp.]
MIPAKVTGHRGALATVARQRHNYTIKLSINLLKRSPVSNPMERRIPIRRHVLGAMVQPAMGLDILL